MQTTDKKTPHRLYLVKPTEPTPDGIVRLVAANHPSQALSHVARASFTVTVPTTMQVAELVAAGVKVEEA
jgi:hypothetical protein